MSCVNHFDQLYTSVTQRVLLVEQEVHTLPGHLSLPSVFRGVRVARSLVFYVVFCRLLFVLFLLTIVLYVLRFTASDYPFGILDLRLLITPLVSLSFSTPCMYNANTISLTSKPMTPMHWNDIQHIYDFREILSGW